MALELKSEAEALVTLKFSEALPGGRDGTVQMTLTSPTTAKGKRGQVDLDMAKE
ncbi:hypothetical protein GmRootA79_41870 [Acidovorax sp. A79]|uniref:hypothetical protein n=1 Tax=Acidovorax sp. A79 TaxID=3056107 RepID=UPI0034E88B18